MTDLICQNANRFCDQTPECVEVCATRQACLNKTIWRAAAGIADSAPLRFSYTPSFQILGAEKEYGSEAAAKEWCLKDFQRRLKNVLAGFEWHETDIGWRGGTPRLYYEVWRDRG